LWIDDASGMLPADADRASCNRRIDGRSPAMAEPITLELFSDYV
jgi:hypothetical protein